jgi:carboxypeptidase C (cathepsin A)
MAEETKKPEEKKEKEEKPTPKDNIVTTKHTVKIGGKTVKYTVTTGTMVMKEEINDKEKDAEVEKPRAQIFFTAYTMDGVKNKAKRPITFSFNGGPGSSSVWLHLGVLGPRRVVLTDDGEMPKPPFKLTDNQYSILDETDLVFIDPMSTGFSRPVEGEKSKEWHTFTKDIASVGDFIRLYTTRYNRWLSPKFLAGESYGTTRAAGLSGYLADRHGMLLNGLMLISAVLDFTTLDFNHNNDLPYILFVPGYTATAWYHGKLDKKDSAARPGSKNQKNSRRANTPRVDEGRLAFQRRTRKVAEKLSRLTGISVEFIERGNLRIHTFHFFKELLRDRKTAPSVGLTAATPASTASASPKPSNMIRCSRRSTVRTRRRSTITSAPNSNSKPTRPMRSSARRSGVNGRTATLKINMSTSRKPCAPQ